jgi:hypothetical protein
LSFPNISAAVVADDGQAYVFSSHYYWKLNFKSGISKGYAGLIINVWPGAPTDMDAAFTVVDQNQEFSTEKINGIHIESINFCNRGI